MMCGILLAGALVVNTCGSLKVTTTEKYVAENAPKVNLSEKVKKETAIKIAELILVDVYGERVLKERPWVVTEHDDPDVYVITGTFNEPPPAKGGVAKIVLMKRNLQVIHYSHSK